MTVVVVGLLVVHNLVTNLWCTDRWYVPVNLATAGLLVLLVGGMVFWLRLATGSLVAPGLVHIAADSGATVAAFTVFRRRDPSSAPR